MRPELLKDRIGEQKKVVIDEVQKVPKILDVVHDVGEFSRFLETMAYSHGSILNISRECQVPRKTLDSYLEILKDLMLGYTIPVFEKRAKRAISVDPKFYFFDPGVFRILRRQGFLDQSTEIERAALEGLVAEHLRSWIDFQKDHNELFFGELVRD
jgi:predicted AAA+ superfamily ATPase